MTTTEAIRVYVEVVERTATALQTGCDVIGAARASVVRYLTSEEVSRHADVTSCWVALSDKVYDVTNFLSEVCVNLRPNFV